LEPHGRKEGEKEALPLRNKEEGEEASLVYARDKFWR